MKSILTAQGKDVTKYLQKNLVQLYERLDNNTYNVDFIRGQIEAIKLFLKEFGIDYELRVELIENGEED